MLMYWVLFLIPAYGVFGNRNLEPRARAFVWASTFTLFATVIGLRHRVGGDWFNYAVHFEEVSHMSLREALSIGDPGFYAINWFVAAAGGEIYEVNLICAILMMAGVVSFCRQQPRPWLALLVAVPYLIIVIGMGYTRQAVAIGFALLGLVALGKQQMRRFVFWILVAVLFHKSAVLLLPLAALAASKKRIWTLVWIGVVTLMGGWIFLLSHADALWQNYVQENMQSEGGAVRVAMNAVPAILLLLLRRRFALEPGEQKLWIWMAIFSLICVPLVSVSSTAVDRVALYFIPIQLFIFSRVPSLAVSALSRTMLTLGILGYCAAVQIIWLSSAIHASYWLPYDFMPL